MSGQPEAERGSGQLRRNMLTGVVGMFGTVGITLLGHGVYVRYLGLETYGLWLMLTTLIMFAQLGDLGVSKALTKLVAEEVGRGDFDLAGEHSANAIAVLCSTGLLALLLAVSLPGPILGSLRLAPASLELARRLFPWVILASGHTLVLQALSGVLAGSGRMDLANYLALGTRVAAVLVGAGLVLAGWGVWGLLYGVWIANLLNHVAHLVLLRRVFPGRIARVRGVSLEGIKRLLKLGSGVVGGSVVQMLLGPFNKLMLTRYVGPAAVPIYELSFAASMAVRSVLDSALRALLPEFSRLSAASAKGVANGVALLNRVQRFVAVGGALVFSLAALFAPICMQVWLGTRYVPEIGTTVRALLVGAYFSLLAVPPYYALLGFGRIRHVFWSHVLQSGTNVLVVMLGILIFSRVSLASVVLGTVAGLVVCAGYVRFQIGLVARESHAPA